MALAMYGPPYLCALVLAQVRGFSALQIGETVVVVGLAQLVMSPFAPRIARRLDLRIMLSIGVAVFAVSMYLTAVLTNQTGFWELFVPQWVRGMGLMFFYDWITVFPPEPTSAQATSVGFSRYPQTEQKAQRR